MDIFMVEHRTEPTRRATTATVPEVFNILAKTSTRVATFTCILRYCWRSVAKCISFLSDGFKYCYRNFVS